MRDTEPAACRLTGTSQRCGMAEKEGCKALHIGRMLMTDKITDPVALWQKMVGEMEKGFNSFANQAMSSPEFSQAVNRAGGVAAGAQKQLGDLMEKYLVSMNLPSRDQVTGLAERLQSIEGQIGEIKSMLSQMAASSGISQGSDTALRPPRTKRPPSEGGETT
jgi:hypothetical protein